ncbi:sugar kinase [Chthonobacter albigriseus]|uniref:sugar kinase n=1 Tax=Chthonobacter albigriseus TaxID=1683161 RepID=UPI0015EECD30
MDCSQGGNRAVSRVFASIGECMIELSAVGEGLYRQGFAGDTFNTAWYVRALSDPSAWTVRYVTALGDDRLSDELRRFISASGMDASRILSVKGRPVGLYAIHLDGHERSFSYWRETSAARLLAADQDHLVAALADADAVYFSGITLAILSPEDRRTLLDALAAVRARGGLVAYDPNVRPRLWPDAETMKAAIADGYRVATVALPTWPDEKDLYGDADPAAEIARVTGYGVPEVVLKAGADPCIVAFDGRMERVPAVSVAEPVDTTGAGDSFNAGYLTARLAGWAPVEAARLGHAVAARVIGVKGALAPMREMADLKP